ncbi:serine/threonine-protein kinase 17A-like, partial [Lingula anatina]|uniref:Serine/threonine-protein kinase 17A-like n=1 Tax=Lingula anatina TaxID=7574 RepID=A0A1S3JF12_LINAN
MEGPQNILLTNPHPHGDVKLCDFGFARLVNYGEDIRDIIGTPDYVAPEVLSYEPIGTYTDIWSVGVLVYVMLTGCSPFAGEDKQETFLNISQVNLDFPEDLFCDISENAIDFISKCLVRQPG